MPTVGIEPTVFEYYVTKVVLSPLSQVGISVSSRFRLNMKVCGYPGSTGITQFAVVRLYIIETRFQQKGFVSYNNLLVFNYLVC